MGERRPGAGAGPGQGLVDRIAVAHHDAPVAGEEGAGFLRPPGPAQAMEDPLLRGHAPDPPARGAAVLVHELPVGLVGADDRRRQHPGQKRPVRRLERLRQGIDLIPKGLGSDHQALAFHDPRLALEREVVEVLTDRHLDRKLRRIASTGDELRRRRRGDYRGVAPAAVLLPPVAHEDEVALDDRDLLGLLALLAEGHEITAAGRAGALGLGQLVDLLDDRQLRLCRRTVTGPGRRLRSRLLADRPRPLLRGAPEEPVLALGEKLLQLIDLELERCRVRPLQSSDFHLEFMKPFKEPEVLPIEQGGDLSQHLDVLLPLDRDHGSIRSERCLVSKVFLQKNRRRKLHLPHQLAPLQKQRQLAHRQAQAALLRSPPQAREAPLFQALAVDAQPGAVPHQDLRQGARPIDEQIEIARERVPAQIPRDQGRETVETLSQVGRAAVRKNPDLSRASDHPSASRRSAASSSLSPSSR